MQKTRRERLKQIVGEAGGGRDTPTPETRRKLRQDVVRRLAARGRLRPEHLDYAEEIRSVHEAVGRGMFPTSQSLIWAGRSPNRQRGRDFLDRMSDAERRAWEHRYLPWTHELAMDISAGMAGTRWLQLVIDIVVDNVSLRQVEARYRLRHGTALDYLVQGLDRYDLSRR